MLDLREYDLRQEVEGFTETDIIQLVGGFTLPILAMAAVACVLSAQWLALVFVICMIRLMWWGTGQDPL
jgi:hypothetical protein